MPTYSYECRACGHLQERFHAISAKPRVKCDRCGGACKRLMGIGAGIIFKGSGFYETDYKKAGAKSDGNGKSESGKKESKDGSGAKTPDTKSSGEKSTSGSESKSSGASKSSD